MAFTLALDGSLFRHWCHTRCGRGIRTQSSRRWRSPPRLCLERPAQRGNEKNGVKELEKFQSSSSATSTSGPCFLPAAAVAAIRDERALQMLQRLERCKDDETVCFYTSSAANIGDDSRPALLLVHGFDSSSLEFRLLVPALERLLPPSMRLFAVDILGWGFGARPPGVDYGPAGKRAHLQRFLRRVVDGGRAGRAPLFFAGASLGGAVVADYFLRAEQAERERIRAAIFIDAQLFVDGKAFRCLVTPLDYLSLLVLRSKILRYWANRLAFHRPELHMSRDMLLISRMPCLTSGWMEASRSFLRANGYALSADLPRLARHRLPVLAIWGAQDRIVPVETVDRLCELYREEGCESLLEVVIIPECGHLPHLEHPDTVAVAIDRYLRISLATLR